jgi:hypothetical protein
LAAGLQAVQTMIGSIEKRIMAQHRSNEASQLLETIPGIDRAGLVVDRGRLDSCALRPSFGSPGDRVFPACCTEAELGSHDLVTGTC